MGYVGLGVLDGQHGHVLEEGGGGPCEFPGLLGGEGLECSVLLEDGVADLVAGEFEGVVAGEAARRARGEGSEDGRGVGEYAQRRSLSSRMPAVAASMLMRSRAGASFSRRASSSSASALATSRSRASLIIFDAFRPCFLILVFSSAGILVETVSYRAMVNNLVYLLGRHKGFPLVWHI